MGAWGAGLFQDDTACDVRDGFRDLIAEGHGPEAATAELERQWGAPRMDPDHEPVFWLALAAAQFRSGRLLPHVRDRALAIIDAGEDSDRFLTAASRSAREAALARVREQLLGPQRKPDRIRMEPRHENDWSVGAVFAYRLQSGRLSLWRVVGHHVDRGGRFAIVEVLDASPDHVPSEIRLALTPPARERYERRQFRMTVMGWTEASDRLRPTGRGRSLLAAAARFVRRRAAGPFDTCQMTLPPGRLDGALKEYLGQQ